MRFLVCVDRSDFSRSILPEARRIAGAAHAEVELLSILPDRAEAPGSEEDEVRAELEAEAAAFDPPAAIVVRRASSAAEAIIAHCKRTQPDVVVLATHSRGTGGSTALGSTTRLVTRSGVAAVLLLHPSAASWPRNVPSGVVVVSEGGDSIGVVDRVEDGDFVVRAHDGVLYRFPPGLARVVTTGRLILDIESDQLLAYRMP